MVEVGLVRLATALTWVGETARQEGRNLMGILMIDFITSLDGYGAAEGWPGWWGMESAEYLGWLGEQPDHTVLMGATTYRLMSGFAASGEEGVDALNRLAKVVFSSTLAEPLAWVNTRLVTGDAIEAVRALKEESGTELHTLGSVSLCRSLIMAELVDRFRVVVFPVITGATGQERIYDGYPDVRLDLVESRTFEGGIQLLEYVPTVLDGPPGSTGAAG
jgi:dihydrofolate reductase